MKLAILFVGLLGLVLAIPSRQLRSLTQFAEQCGTASGAYCLNERQFILCDLTIPPEKQYTFTCPLANQYCGDVAGACAAEGSGVAKTVNTRCETCSTSRGTGHSCLSYHHWTPCADGVRDDENEPRLCPKGTFCNADAIDTSNPCTEFSGRELLCWRDLPEKPPVTDLDICNEKGEGRFHILGEHCST